VVLASDLSQINGRLGKRLSSASIVSAMICDTARLRSHLWFDGIMYHGATRVLVARIASSKAAM
jgi:hypothetical protein